MRLDLNFCVRIYSIERVTEMSELFAGLTRQEAINCLRWTMEAFIAYICITAIVAGAVVGIYLCCRLSKRNKLTLAYIRLKGRAWTRAIRQEQKDMNAIYKEVTKKRVLQKLGIEVPQEDSIEGRKGL